MNGTLHKFDGVFLSEFHAKELKDLNIVVGSYPICVDDCIQLKFLGVTGVLNLLSDEEMKNFDYNKTQMIKYFGDSNI